MLNSYHLTMIQLFKKLTAATLITLLISVSSVMASGKMEVNIGDRVDLMAEADWPGIEYKWVVKKGHDILATQTSRSFVYKFDSQGEYTVNLTATMGLNRVESTTIKVLSGERYPRPGVEGEDSLPLPTGPVLNLVLETLPHRSPDGSVSVLGDGKVRFDLSRSAGEILEYRIDQNIFVDSDGNGTANDDIDNSNHDSYLTGQPWITDYKQEESAKHVAEITLVDQSGKKVKEQVEMVFRDRDDSGEPVAVMDVSPAVSKEDNLVHLYEDVHRVGFYARRSTGKILEYRIDRNIFEDSDSDGNPGNDIDNINDISFKTGDVWETEYNKTDDQIIAQLIVVGEGGKGSRIQKSFVFGEKPAPPAPPITQVEAGIRLTSDKDFVVKGDPITFTVAGLQLGLDQYNFEWDFDGDGEMDKETEGDNVVTHIYELPGVFEVSVNITDQEGNSAEKTLEIFSKDAEITKADFTFSADGNTVYFTNISTVATNLANKKLDYVWSFGDTDPVGYAEQKSQIGQENPFYTYNYAGNYVVTLQVTDADQVVDSKSADIEILEDYVPRVEDEGLAIGEGEESQKTEGGSIFVKLLKVLLYLVLIIIILIVLIVGGFLVFLKVQHPDLAFHELVDELKAKLLTMMGVHEFPPSAEAPGGMPETPSGEPGAPVPPPADVEAEIPPASEETPVESMPTGRQAKTPPPPAEPGPTPSWMKDKPAAVDTLAGKEVIEGEVEEEPLDEPAPPPAEEPAAPPPPAEESAGDDEEPPVPPAPPAGGGTPPAPPAPETDAPASKEGPTPDWLKGA